MGHRPFLALAFVVCGALLAGCEEPKPEALRFGLASMPDNLDPRYATDAASYRILRLLYRQLVDFDEQLRPVPALATWQRITPTHYRFTLREDDRTFHDGSRLTSRDVKATLGYILDPANASPHRSSLALIQRIETPDEDTVDFFLDRADPLFPGYLVVGIMPAELMAQKHAFERRPVGSGPFVFETWPEGGRLRIKRRNDGQVVEFVHVPNPTVRVLKLMRGEVDMTQNNLLPELVNYLATEPGIRVTRHQGSNFAYLGFNLQDPVVGRLVVRQAIAHALDREAIIDKVFGAAARPAAALLPPSHWAGHPELSGYPHDPDKARALLREAGFDKPLELTYKTSSDPFRVRLATIFQHQLAAVGIRMDIRSYDWGTFYGDIKGGNFQLYSLAWIGIKMPDIFRYAFHSTAVPPKGANRGRFVEARVDRLIEQAEGAVDLDEKAVYYRDLQDVLLQKLPYVPLWYEDHVFVSRDDITGYTLAPDGNFDGLLSVSRKP